MNVLRSASVLSLVMLVVYALIFQLVAGCSPTPFRVGDVTQPPHGCTEAKERGHEC